VKWPNFDRELWAVFAEFCIYPFGKCQKAQSISKLLEMENFGVLTT
jgi:hypothetical protein